ncbi:MAG: hypothetical protein NZ805_07110 [Armatimonadetes bacterium]|nr:hypothetical protein [Armatimonadota bacterium]MDW8028291.1 hypothetical protein [Armatimonadota bacterium]
MSMTAEKQNLTKGLALTVLVYGAAVIVAYMAGWISPRVCESLSSIPCFLVAVWYAWIAVSQKGTVMQKWGRSLFAIGWLLIGLAFLLPAGAGRLVALSSAAPTLLVGFGTTLLANWYEHGEGGTKL